MGLRLTVSSRAGARATYDMRDDRMLIGRRSDNDVVLEDKQNIISKAHAYISLEQGRYVLVDTSTNGVRVNGNYINSNAPIEINEGDAISIGDYDLSIEIVSTDAGLVPEPDSMIPSIGPGIGQTETHEHTSDPLGGVAPDAPQDPIEALINPKPNIEPSSPQAPDVHDHDEGSHALPIPNVSIDPATPQPPEPAEDDMPEWLRAIKGGEQAPSEPAAQAIDPQPSLPQQPASEPSNPPGPEPFAQPSAQPPGSDPFAQPSAPPPAPPIAASPPGGSTSDAAALEALSSALGVRLQTLDAATLHEIGSVLNILVGGFVEVLRARAEAKNQMRLVRTILEAQDNNPIKSATTAQDALQMMFVNRRQGFLDAVRAAEDVVRDVAAHEIAMVTAFRVAMKEAASQLDPDALERLFEDSSGGGFSLGIGKGSKNWESYREYYDRQLADGELMMKIFVDAYDDALARLKGG